MIIKKIWSILKIAIFFFIANMVAAFLLGLLSGLTSFFGGNIIFTGVESVNFNPLITIAYLVLFYFLLMFHRPAGDKQYGLFLLTIILSFMMNFLQGSILLVIFFYISTKLKLF